MLFQIQDLMLIFLHLYVETLGSDAVEVKRLTRILINNKLFNYPLSPFGTLFKIGFLGAIKILLASISLFHYIEEKTQKL